MQRFWVVAPVTDRDRIGGGPGYDKHVSKDDAIAGATDRANKTPGTRFVIMESVGSVIVQPQVPIVEVPED